MKREDVYKAIDTEREYQNVKWNPATTGSGGVHSFEEWFTYIEDYITEAKHVLSRLPVPDCNDMASDIMRKVAAMAVCAMEQRGVKNREMPKIIGYGL